MLAITLSERDHTTNIVALLKLVHQSREIRFAQSLIFQIQVYTSPFAVCFFLSLDFYRKILKLFLTKCVFFLKMVHFALNFTTRFNKNSKVKMEANV